MTLFSAAAVTLLFAAQSTTALSIRTHNASLSPCFAATTMAGCLTGNNRSACVWDDLSKKCQFECGTFTSDKNQCEAHSEYCRWDAHQSFCAPGCSTFAEGQGDTCYQLAGCGWNPKEALCYETLCNQVQHESDCSLLKCIWLAGGACSTSYCASQSLTTCMTSTSPQLCWIEADYACSTNSCFEIFNKTACNSDPYGCKWENQSTYGAPFASPNGTCISSCENAYLNRAGCALAPQCMYNITTGKCKENHCAEQINDSACAMLVGCTWALEHRNPSSYTCQQRGYECSHTYLNEASCNNQPDCTWDSSAKVCIPFVYF